MPPVLFLGSLAWSPADLVEGSLTDEFALTDASGRGLGVYFPWLRLGFHCLLPSDPPRDTIFFFEALAVVSAIHRVCAWRAARRFVSRLAILTDNTNTVNLFNTLRASPPYNSLLRSAVDARAAARLDVRVDHVPGSLNVVADALSRGNLDVVREIVPGITLLPLIPPQDAMGVFLS
ncbi:hypothetical protein FKP32DRAFT_1572414 [Trametes sanguinea]|nr:hypothetical protein FKP32DRAFT_1572414 [Trametes sanguinea]